MDNSQIQTQPPEFVVCKHPFVTSLKVISMGYLEASCFEPTK